MDDALRTNNVFYGGCTVARYEVCIKRNHCYTAIFSLRTDVLTWDMPRLYNFEYYSRKEKRL